MHRAAHDHQGIGLVGVFKRFFQAIRVFAAVLELEGINRQHFLPDFIAAFVVQKSVETSSCTNAVVVVAAGANVLIRFQIALYSTASQLGHLIQRPSGTVRPVFRGCVDDFGWE
jgi:hypothetical protein